VGLLDQATQLGIFLPFNRTQESEADSIGVLLMARAGFDPGESIALWLNMSAGGGARPPEMLSTHPAPETRIDDLIALQRQALQLREAALASGRNPDCGS
jgi:predicted Zn-dependent protease